MGVPSGAGSPLPLEPEPVATPGTASNMVKVKADVIEYDRNTKKGVARGNVDVHYQDARIATEFLQLDQASETVTTDRPFVLTQKDPKGPQTIKGSGLSYGLKSQDATVKDAFLTVPAPNSGRSIYVSGEELRSQKRKKFNVKNGIFSTCEEVVTEETPHYHITSKSLELEQDEYVMGWDSWIYVNNRRLFWIPYFWIPLKKRETTFDFGQNDVEGLYAKTKVGYRLSDQHHGRLLLDYMQKKGPGIGVDHQWAGLPNNLTLFETYGLGQSDPNPELPPTSVGLIDPLLKHGLDKTNRRPFDDFRWHVKHQQRLLDTMTINLDAEDFNIYTVQNAVSAFGPNMKSRTPGDIEVTDIREDHAANSVSINDNRSGITYDLNRTFKEDRANRGAQTNSLNKGYTGRTSWTNQQTSINADANYTTNRTRPAPLLGATVSASPEPNSQDNTNLTAKLTVNQKLNEKTQASWDNRYARTSQPQGGTLPPKAGEELEETVTVSSDLGWGDAKAVVNKLFLLQPNGKDPVNIKTRAFSKDTLPELELKSKPLFPEIQPFTLAADMGRYFEWSQIPQVPAAQAQLDPALRPYLGTISRFHPHVDLNSKAHDIGLRSTLDFGGTGFEQRFYSTGDQAFSTSLSSSVNTTYTEWLRQTLTYRKVLPGGELDPNVNTVAKSTTPFNWDALSLAKSTTLNGTEVFDFWGKANWTHGLGYDYERLRYNDYTTSLNMTPDPRITGTLSSSYHFKEQPSLDFKEGKWNVTTLGLALRSTNEAFGDVFGADKITPGARWKTDLNWDPDRNKITSLTSEAAFVFGSSWRDHWELFVGGTYELEPIAPSAGNPKGDPDHRVPKLARAGIARDLHDFILSFDVALQQGGSIGQADYVYTLRLKMIAFNQDLLNLSSQGGLNFGLGIGATP